MNVQYTGKTICKMIRAWIIETYLEPSSAWTIVSYEAIYCYISVSSSLNVIDEYLSNSCGGLSVCVCVCVWLKHAYNMQRDSAVQDHFWLYSKFEASLDPVSKPWILLFPIQSVMVLYACIPSYSGGWGNGVTSSKSGYAT